MELHKTFGTVVLVATSLLLTVVACGETSVSPTPTSASLPPPTSVPLSPPTPTLEERAVQTPTDFGYNTKVVADDIHVWHAPHCPPVPPAIFVASVILTHLVSPYSYLHLKRDGTVTGSNYRTEEARQRFAEVLEDSALMERILTRPECP
jgi:hypothetical protein